MPDVTTITTAAKILKTLKSGRNTILAVGIALVMIVAVALMFPRGEVVQLEYKVGGIWAQKDLIAPFAFPILREEREYARDVEEAKKGAYEVFSRDTLAVERQTAELEKFFGNLSTALQTFARYQQSIRNRRPSLVEDSLAFRQSASVLDMTLSDREWSTLALVDAAGRLPEMQEAILSAMREYLRTGVLDRAKSSLQRSDVALRVGTTEEIVPVDHLLDISDIVTLLETRLRERYGAGRNDGALAYKIGITHISPSLIFDRSATELAMTAVIDAVPRTLGFVQENERIVSKHERITLETKLKLDSFRRARADRGPVADAPTQFLGALLHVAIVVTLYGIYLYLFRKRIIGNSRKLALIALLMLIVGFIAYITREVDVSAPLEYLVVVPAASMLLTIFFDSRVGFYGTVTLSLLVAGIRGNDYSIALASIVAGALSVYTVRDMKNRTQIFRSMSFILLGYTLSILALGLERYEPVGLVVEQFSFALANAVISPVMTYGLLIFLERTFRLTTDLTLIELAQFNHPLLRLLSEKAPGTYHHSVSIATLAEAAAAAIGANEVLTRAGAYFHDVGKIIKPTYFVENQKGPRSRHDKLAPRMSSLIIAAHVKEGMALAREYNLPEEVVDFIPMHHGTTRIDYFYNKALELAKISEDETKIDEINEQDYRYPGPKPQTRETGIMMLADAIEAAVRTIDEPTPQRIEDLINDLVRKRLIEGQLDECPLTLKDLTAIKAAFLNVLVGVYHSRVKYPEPEKKRVRTPGKTQSPPSKLAQAEENILPMNDTENPVG